MPERILVTGFGFIARHLVPRLSGEGYRVTVLERKPDVEALGALGADPIVGDVRDAGLLGAIVPEFDGVIHLAALLGTSEMIDDPVPAIATNITGAVNVFQACRRSAHLGRPVRCVYVSVASYFMNNTYAITKHTAERFAEMFSAEHGADIRVVRVQNVYGEYQKAQPVRKIVPTFVRAALRNEPLKIYGSGEQAQDMIYAGDAARILSAVLSGGRPRGLISAGTGRALSVNDIARVVIEATGGRAQVERVPMRRGEPAHSVVVGDPSTLIPLGIDPASLVRFEEGIRRTVDWYCANPSYLE